MDSEVIKGAWTNLWRFIAFVLILAVAHLFAVFVPIDNGQNIELDFKKLGGQHGQK